MELTASMSCLRKAIDDLRHTRMSFLENLAEETREMKTAVATMRARFAFARAQRSAKTKLDLTDFVSDLKHRMTTLRQDIRADLTGARRAWDGRAVAFETHRQAEAFGMPERKKGKQKSA